MSIHYPVLAQFFLPRTVRFQLLNCEHACYSGIVLPLSLNDCSHSQSGLDVSAHGFCGVKHLVLRGVNHNRNKNSLTCVWIQACLSSRLCLSYSITFINGGMAVKLICWGGNTGRHLRDILALIGQINITGCALWPYSTVAYITLNVNWPPAVGCRPPVLSARFIFCPKCN